MKKGFFLLASLAALFNNGGVIKGGIKKMNTSLKNANPISGGGSGNTKNMKRIMEKKRKLRKTTRRIIKHSRNLNHKKAA